jgi:hypothetical protein
MAAVADVAQLAEYLGLDVQAHPTLSWILSEASTCPLPLGWTVATDPGSGADFYYRPEDPEAQTIWNHPCDAYFQSLFVNCASILDSAPTEAPVYASIHPCALDLINLCLFFSIDPHTRPDLTWIATLALLCPCPPHWEQQPDGTFLETVSGATQDVHPGDDLYLRIAAALHEPDVAELTPLAPDGLPTRRWISFLAREVSQAEVAELQAAREAGTAPNTLAGDIPVVFYNLVTDERVVCFVECDEVPSLAWACSEREVPFRASKTSPAPVPCSSADLVRPPPGVCLPPWLDQFGLYLQRTPALCAQASNLPDVVPDAELLPGMVRRQSVAGAKVADVFAGLDMETAAFMNDASTADPFARRVSASVAASAARRRSSAASARCSVSSRYEAAYNVVTNASAGCHAASPAPDAPDAPAAPDAAELRASTASSHGRDGDLRGIGHSHQSSLASSDDMGDFGDLGDDDVALDVFVTTADSSRPLTPADLALVAGRHRTSAGPAFKSPNDLSVLEAQLAALDAPTLNVLSFDDARPADEILTEPPLQEDSRDPFLIASPTSVFPDADAGALPAEAVPLRRSSSAVPGPAVRTLTPPAASTRHSGRASVPLRPSSAPRTTSPLRRSVTIVAPSDDALSSSDLDPQQQMLQRHSLAAGNSPVRRGRSAPAKPVRRLVTAPSQQLTPAASRRAETASLRGRGIPVTRAASPRKEPHISFADSPYAHATSSPLFTAPSVGGAGVAAPLRSGFRADKADPVHSTRPGRKSRRTPHSHASRRAMSNPSYLPPSSTPKLALQRALKRGGLTSLGVARPRGVLALPVSVAVAGAESDRLLNGRSPRARVEFQLVEPQRPWSPRRTRSAQGGQQGPPGFRSDASTEALLTYHVSAALLSDSRLEPTLGPSRPSSLFIRAHCPPPPAVLRFRSSWREFNGGDPGFGGIGSSSSITRQFVLSMSGALPHGLRFSLDAVPILPSRAAFGLSSGDFGMVEPCDLHLGVLVRFMGKPITLQACDTPTLEWLATCANRLARGVCVLRDELSKHEKGIGGIASLADLIGGHDAMGKTSVRALAETCVQLQNAVLAYDDEYVFHLPPGL